MDSYKAEKTLPPIKEPKRNLVGITSGVIAAKQIFLNFTGKSLKNPSPKHIRTPKQRNQAELRYSTRSQLSSIDPKPGKKFRIFNPPLSMEKEFLTKRIKRTVRHYFHARRTTMDSYLTIPEFKENDPKKELAEKAKEQDKKGVFRFDFELEEKKDISLPVKVQNSQVSSKSFMVMNFQNQVEVLESPKAKTIEKAGKTLRQVRNEKHNSRKKTNELGKIDQGLQTDEKVPSRESSEKRHGITSISMYEIQDETVEVDN